MFESERFGDSISRSFGVAALSSAARRGGLTLFALAVGRRDVDVKSDARGGLGLICKSGAEVACASFQSSFAVLARMECRA